MTLTAIGNSSRPFQTGRAHGVNPLSGGRHSLTVDWLVDTGADWSAVLPNLAMNFATTTPVPAVSAPPAGSAYRLAAGIEVEFTVWTKLGQQTVCATTPVIAIKANNVGSNLIGVPELADRSAEVRWNARTRTGELRR
ncbi:hypothetical protein [Kribbella sp. CA-247076]|uniref:hypothetical protein n=1 Tax=Kribbella sp. CA-247076 TaxID=3239941 RepID=UPI003D946F09